MDTFSMLKQTLENTCPSLELRQKEPMSRHTTFRVGGPVSLMALPKTVEEATEALTAAFALGIEPFILGKGSNLLVADEGLSAFVIKCTSGPEGIVLETEDTLYAQAGVSLSQVAVFALDKGLSGLEFAHGIPGTLGGAVYMNAGAYDGEMAQVVTEVDCITRDGRRETLGGPALGFGYRHSVFSDDTRLILGARIRLKPGKREEIQEKLTELMERRRTKQPLEFPSAGSTFKRPPGQFAGSLIERCGLKGAQIGGAQVSEKHAGFVINAGGATCADVLALMKKVRETVKRETGILLEPEVKLLGCKL